MLSEQGWRHHAEHQHRPQRDCRCAAGLLRVWPLPHWRGIAYGSHVYRQKLDGTGLQYYNSRYYDPTIGAFISPDTIVPDASNVFDYNRYVYARGNALKYNDPTGHDPLDTNWEAEFEANHGSAPTDQDRRDRLFSLMFLGSGSNGAWTQENWDLYLQYRNNFWTGDRLWPGEAVPSLERFASHTNRLAQYYEPDEILQFVNAFAFVYGSIPLGYPIPATLDMIRPGDNFAAHPPLFEGEVGWNPALLDGDLNPSHHYAGLYHTGFYYGSWSGLAANWLRDGPLSDYNQADINLGNGAARQGWDLYLGHYTFYQLGNILRISLSDQPYLLAPGYPE